MATLLDMAKTALRLKTDDAAILQEINQLLLSGIADLDNTAGIDVGELSPASEAGAGKTALLMQAVLTYVRANFGVPEEREALVRSYEMQKGNLKTAFRKALTNGSDGND